METGDERPSCQAPAAIEMPVTLPVVRTLDEKEFHVQREEAETSAAEVSAGAAADVVAMVLNENRPIVEVARAIGVNEGTLRQLGRLRPPHELGVWDKSHRDTPCVYASEHDARLYDAILWVISSGDFPKPGDRANLTKAYATTSVTLGFWRTTYATPRLRHRRPACLHSPRPPRCLARHLPHDDRRARSRRAQRIAARVVQMVARLHAACL